MSQKNVFASCWVIVLPPSTLPPAKTSRNTALDRLHINAVMFVKPFIFNGDKGISHIFRNLLNGYRLAIFRIEARDFITVLIDDF